MSKKEEFKNKVQDVTGKVVEKVDDIAGDNKNPRSHRKVEQAQARLKQAGEKVRDAFSH